jgi:hypothetical protein
MEVCMEKESEKIVRPKIKGGIEASQPSDPNSLYPNGVDPSISDEDHNARGQWSPYSEKQRKAAAVLIRRYHGEGMTLQEASTKAFKEVGEPEFIDEVTHGAQKGKDKPIEKNH